MFTSDTDRYTDTIVIDSYEITEERHTKLNIADDLKTAVIYLGISIFLAFFGAVYEYFSHGVFSYFMIYAFAIPLLGGAVPYLIKFIKGNDSGKTAEMNYSGMWHAAIATFTLGSILKGVLDIYGTTNRLMIVYPVAGLLLIAAVIVAKVRTEHK